MVDVLAIIKNVVGKAQATNKKNLELLGNEPTSSVSEREIAKAQGKAEAFDEILSILEDR